MLVVVLSGIIIHKATTVITVRCKQFLYADLHFDSERIIIPVYPYFWEEKHNEHFGKLKKLEILLLGL